ncbi:hypothetical protein SAMN05444166_6215 [Singulisphaera sp. GP187]|uniref:hypothetical protein n=1 Tax=Singulisphaera sp. GP187 TaxID=1882752 RepID=UPI000927D7A9|nr:hypothetical protein [Singulisphaera sp. GP187]SIO59949.1 hypothetical protein SAMN05444166_6215 [Singulisphaera sp. GP187]
MRRLIRLLTWGVLAALAVGFLSSARAGEDPPPSAVKEPTTPIAPAIEEPKPEPSVAPAVEEPKPIAPVVEEPKRVVPDAPPPPVYIFLNSPAELAELWKKLKQPDFILLRGDELRKQAEPLPEGVSPLLAAQGIVVRSVAIRGAVVGEMANLSVHLVVATPTPGPNRVALRLDNQTVTRAIEKDRPLPLRVIPGGGWEVELSGQGEHQVQVDLKVRLRSTTEGRSLELGIPEAPSTQVELDVDQVVSDAQAGPVEPVNREPIHAGKGTRLSSHLSPRSRLDLSWRVEAEPGAQLPPLLSIQGDIAIDVDPGAFRARSSWAITSVRGAMRSLELQLDPDDEVLEVTLDGQSIPAGIERDGAERRLSIPLTEPLRPGPTKRLSMTTQRKLPPQSSARLSFHGFPLSNAKEQFGAIGIAQRGNLVISPTVGRGLRRIDPRTELPDDLRARPGTFLAYQFVDQPFDLELRIEPSPPLVQFDARTTIRLGAGQAKIDTWLGVETANGRLFDLNLVLPKGLELESVGPPDMIESWQLSPEREEGRIVTARLTFRAQEGNSFALHLVGRQAIDPTRSVAVALFQPRESSLGGGRIAVLTDRNLTVDVAERTEGSARTEAFRSARQEPPADWPWPPNRSIEDKPALWLRYDGTPATLPLRLVVHPRSVAHETSLVFQVGRRGVDGRQETEFAVHFGTLEHVDVDVPPELVNRWEVEDGDVASRTDLGPTPKGGRLFRLKFADEVTDRAKLTFRFRRPLAAELEPDRETEIDASWLRFPLGEAAPVRARVASDPGIRVEVVPGGWQRGAGEEATASPGALPLHYRLLSSKAETDTPPLRLTATALTLTPLPSLIASRLWLRTVQGPENDLRTTAWFWVETHESTLSVSLPREAVLSRVRVGGVPVDRKEQLPNASGYRFRFPSQAGSGPLLVALEYVVPATAISRDWTPPQLLNGIVQQTRWEVVVPSSREIVGVPSGWTDENQWYWDKYVWRRRPWKSTEDLASWASGSTSRTRGVNGWDEDGRGDYHAYLFEHPGQPPELRPLIATRGSLVALCSGPVLALGVLVVVYRRPRFRLLWSVLLALALAVAASAQPSLTLQVVQCAMVGVVFTLLAAALQRIVDRPGRGATAVFGEPGNLGTSPNGGSSVHQAGGVGSDDSTAIRVRQVSTVDHALALSQPTSDTASGRGSSRNIGQ